MHHPGMQPTNHAAATATAAAAAVAHPHALGSSGSQTKPQTHLPAPYQCASERSPLAGAQQSVRGAFLKERLGGELEYSQQGLQQVRQQVGQQVVEQQLQACCSTN